LESALEDVFDHLENRTFPEFRTGFSDLDYMLNGLQPGELTILASRPGIGKSALANNIAEHLTVDEAIPVGAITFEMSSEQYARRLLCSRACVDQHRLRLGFLNLDEYEKVCGVVGEAANAPLFVCSAPGATLEEVCEISSNLVREANAKVIIIDYVQMIEATGQNRTEELTLVSRRLKSLALREGIAVLALSQLNRNPTYGTEFRPRIADLRGSGTLEDDADVVLLLHREDYYRMQEPDFQPDNIAEIIIAKQRNGPTGTVKLTFLNKSTRFVNLAAQNDPFA
jgi:replicative DNA helicase